MCFITGLFLYILYMSYILSFTGDLFDKRQFHDRLLSLGPVPLRILEEEMYNWMAEVNGVTKYSPDNRIKIMVSSSPVNPKRLHTLSYILMFILLKILQVHNFKT